MVAGNVKITNLLLLGGTAEALHLSAELANFPNLKIINSLAGRTHSPKLSAGEYRIGGFGGIKGLQEYLTKETIHLVIDATHPFAEQMQRNIQTATSLSHIPLLRFGRNHWVETPQDQWLPAENFIQAASILEKLPNKRVFLTIGSQNLSYFRPFSDIFFLVRVIGSPSQAVPLNNYQLIYGRGPFTKQSEKDLLVLHQIDLLISKNSGGAHTYAKIMAAQELHIPVLMISPPIIASANMYQTVTQTHDAVAWLQNQLTKKFSHLI